VSQIRNRNFKDPVLVMGDFNAVENSRSISYLKGEVPLQDHTGQSRLNDISLVDTVRAILPNAKYLGTTHGFTGNRDRERLDYIFVSEGFEVQNAMIVRKSSNGRYPSDHFPVIADLKLR
jgi:endonuclease/exonuclease/phosphatase family metal-dependent hydrolase